MTDTWRGWALVVAQFALLVVLAVAPTGTAWSAGPFDGAAGAGLRVAGGVLVVVGILQLGRGAHVHPAPTAAAELRTGGAYRWVRHPIYTGVLVIGAAMAVGGRSVLHLVAWLGLVAVLIVKTQLEERLLVRRFPGYPAYAARAGRFLPRVRGTG